MKHTQPPVDLSFTLYVCGGSLLGIAILLRLYCRRRRTRFHSPLDVGQVTLSENIARRKQDLQRFISTLQRQLTTRQQQLDMHDRVEQVLTARQALETPPSDDPRWNEIMQRGKEMYQDEWEVGTDGQLPLGVLLTMHKDELLAATTRATPPTLASSHAKAIDRQNHAMLIQQEYMQKTARSQQGVPGSVLPVPVAASQWKSQRPVGPSAMQPRGLPLPKMAPSSNTTWSHHRFHPDANLPPRTNHRPPPVPRLNLQALLSASSTRFSSTSTSPAPGVVSIKDIFKRVHA
ncbi:hypothetical protein H257_08616 [Aphanomyces astaci]|uniref:Uncharacterized protein n=1 Tax=Aphanomyces astaci TaxID=112090 RepID=W4GES0_APHAT|nr:hypothetical protein H257_08616 [Aphanomyces astaci]ETV77771.1 hypothetical protein H257_08616 [Aphanomyces astaci]|eukprot:XP_009832881.1 hypothetical protein H257_08616 [Aphanomyces astaci]